MTVENLFHIYVSSLSGGRIDVFHINADTGEMSREPVWAEIVELP